jgi:hypothetical protein
MDEECLRPGEPTDKSFLAKMNENLSSHDHYISHRKAGKELQKTMSREVRSKLSFIFISFALASIWGRRIIISATTVYRLHQTSFMRMENKG